MEHRRAQVGGGAPKAPASEPEVQECMANYEQLDLALLGPQPGRPYEGQGRNPGYDAYREFLWARLAELQDTEKAAAPAAAQNLLGQAVRVESALKNGLEIDVALLPHSPRGGSDVAHEHLPPEWLDPGRRLLQMSTPSVAGDGPSPETLQSLSLDVEADESSQIPLKGHILGLPSYRTQSDNLASPEATCNGTALAMVLERVGFSRKAVVEAIDRLLKTDQLKSQGTSDGAIKDMSKLDFYRVSLSEGAWEQQVQQYFQVEQGERSQKNVSRSKNYQRLRNGRTNADQRDEFAGEFRESASMEDLLLMMMSMLGIERTWVNVGGATTKKILDTVHAGNEHFDAPSMEKITGNWADMKPQLAECLEAGGGAMMSINHKKSGASGGHIVSVQSVTEEGVIVDDPYGMVHDQFTQGGHQDAYKRRTSEQNQHKNVVDYSATDDWKAGTELQANERLGDSNEWTDAMIKKSLRYVALYRRGKLVGD